MTREDALALLDVFRLDVEAPPPADSGRVARRFVEIVSRRSTGESKDPLGRDGAGDRRPSDRQGAKGREGG
ncbi:MAG TPA: hypothetical protein VHG92_04110 [Afifellaceae bacterium]|nr:hypothetical protein [Afifellaceae bacterium]